MYKWRRFDIIVENFTMIIYNDNRYRLNYGVQAIFYYFINLRLLYMISDFRKQFISPNPCNQNKEMKFKIH